MARYIFPNMYFESAFNFYGTVRGPDFLAISANEYIKLSYLTNIVICPFAIFSPSNSVVHAAVGLSEIFSSMWAFARAQWSIG